MNRNNAKQKAQNATNPVIDRIYGIHLKVCRIFAIVSLWGAMMRRISDSVCSLCVPQQGGKKKQGFRKLRKPCL